jgi:hypothetical protein
MRLLVVLASAPEFFFDAFAHQQRTPAAGPRVALAGAIGEEFYGIAHYDVSRKLRKRGARRWIKARACAD